MAEIFAQEGGRAERTRRVLRTAEGADPSGPHPALGPLPEEEPATGRRRPGCGDPARVPAAGWTLQHPASNTTLPKPTLQILSLPASTHVHDEAAQIPLTRSLGEDRARSCTAGPNQEHRNHVAVHSGRPPRPEIGRTDDGVRSQTRGREVARRPAATGGDPPPPASGHRAGASPGPQGWLHLDCRGLSVGGGPRRRQNCCLMPSRRGGRTLACCGPSSLGGRGDPQHPVVPERGLRASRPHLPARFLSTTGLQGPGPPSLRWPVLPGFTDCLAPGGS